MKIVYSLVAGFAVVALACAPAFAGDEKSKTTDTQQPPKSESSAASEPKSDASGATTDSPSASPSTQGSTDSTLNPSMKSDQPAASPLTTDQKDKDASGTSEDKDKPKN
jgi:hypothetical protein